MSGAPARLILFTPPLEGADAGDCARQLAEAARAADVASVVLRLARGCEDAKLAPLMRFAESRDVALLVAGDVDRAARAGFDGVHVVEGGETLTAAIRKLQPGRIVGVGGLDTRDEAMAAGEAGADYVMFGENAAPRRAAELIAWWAEVMEPPCAGYARTLEELEEYSEAGADFFALAPELWRGPDGVGAAWRRLSERAA